MAIAAFIPGHPCSTAADLKAPMQVVNLRIARMKKKGLMSLKVCRLPKSAKESSYSLSPYSSSVETTRSIGVVVLRHGSKSRQAFKCLLDLFYIGPCSPLAFPSAWKGPSGPPATCLPSVLLPARPLLFNACTGRGWSLTAFPNTHNNTTGTTRLP